MFCFHKQLYKTGIVLLFSWLIFSGTNLEAQIRVMPLGDGVALGTGSATNDVGGFRDDLFLMLNSNAIPFDFVGSLNDGVTIDPDHEGHAGTTISSLNQSLPNYLFQYRPHIVIISLGTEEVISSTNSGTFNATQMSNDLTNTVNLIATMSSETEIYLTTLNPNRNPFVDSNIDQLNVQIQQIAITQKAFGKNIALVDLNQAFKSNNSWSSDYMSDDNFPNDLGYTIISNNLFDVINQNSIYLDRKEYSDNFNNQVNLGVNWTAGASFKVQSNELNNSSTQQTWDNMIASVNSVVNPNTIEYRFSAVNADAAGIAGSGVVILLDAASTSSNGYLISIDNNLLSLYSLNQGKIGSGISQLDIGNLFPQPGEKFRVLINKDGQGYHFTAYIESNLVGTVSHNVSTNPNQIHFGGVMLKGGLNNNIDDFHVSNVVDEIAPAGITDLAVVRTGASSVQFQWTASGDDGSNGQADHYDIRYANFAIDESNFDSANQAAVIRKPQPAQSQEKIYISGLTPNTRYYFAIKVVDENDNRSPISNVVQATLVNAAYFLDDFDAAELSQQWSAAPGVGISNGKLVTSQAADGWNSHAVIKTPPNAFEAGFQWAADVASDQIKNAALLFKLDANSSQSNGYMIEWVPISKKFKLWSVIQGAPTDELDSFSFSSQSIKPGDFLKAYFYSDGVKSTFAIFINDAYWGELNDANNIFGNSDPSYAGLLLRGNSTVAVENYFQYSPYLVPATISYVSGRDQTARIGQDADSALVVQVVDNNGTPVLNEEVKFSVFSGGAVLKPSGKVDQNIRIEAETGVLTAPFVIQEDFTASQNQYITVPLPNPDQLQGVAAYSFDVPETGTYVIWGRCIAPSGTEDSFYLAVDGGQEYLWEPFQNDWTSQWKWDLVSDRGNGNTSSPESDPVFFNLNQGSHTLIITSRDENTKLDKLLITSDLTYVPQGTEDNIYPTDFNGLAKAYFNFGRRAGTTIIRAWLESIPNQEIRFEFNIAAGDAAKIIYVSGNNQSGHAGDPLAQPFVARVVDEFNNPVSNQPVNFVITKGNGQLSSSQPVITDQNGDAAVTLTLATDIPENTVEARADGLTGSPVVFTATASAGFPTKIVYVSGNNQTGVVGQNTASPLVVKVVDDENNPIPGFTVRFENRSQIGGSLGDSSVVSDNNGEASTGFTFGQIAGNYQIAAIGDSLQNSPVLFDLTANSGPAVKMEKVSGDSALGVSDYPLSSPFVVRLVDQFGNVSIGETVTFTVIEGGGHFQNAGTEITVNTDDSGEAKATLVLGPITGNYNNKVKAVKTGLTGSPIIFVATALPPTASHLTLYDGNNQIGGINQELPKPLQVKVANAIGEPAKNHPVVFHVISGGGIFTGSLDTVQTVLTDGNGIASANFRCGPNAGQDANVINVTSKVGETPLIGSPVWFKISARYPGVKISIVRGNNQSGLINTRLPEPLEVKIVDDQNNPVAGQAVQFLLKSKIGKLDDGPDTLITKQTNVTGKASVSLTLGNESGLNNHIVQVSATDGFQPLQGSPITFLASAASTLSANLVQISGLEQTGTVGQKLSSPIRIKVTDQYNQPVENQSVVFAVFAGGGFVGGAADTLITVQTGKDGTAQADWWLGTKSGQLNNELRVSANNGIKELNGSPLIFSASARADVTDPDLSGILATSPVKADGKDRSTISVYLKDRYENPIVGKGVVLTVSGDYAFLQQPATVTDDSGKTVGYLTSIRTGEKKVYARNLSDNVLLSSFATVMFRPSEASRLSITAGNGQKRNIGTALANPLIVTVTDDYENPIPNHPVNFIAKTSNGYIVEPQPVLTDSFGLARANYVLSDEPGNNVIHADAGSLTGSPAIFTAIGEENPAYRIVYHSGNNLSGRAGQMLSEPLSVRVLDRAENPVKNVDVKFIMTFGDGQVLDRQPVQTDAFGITSSRVILGKKVGTNLIAASAPGLIGSPFTFVANVLPGAAAQLKIVDGNRQQINLQAQSTPLKVCVLDNYDNPVPGAGVFFEVVSGFASVISNQPAVSNNQGQASAIVLAQTVSGEIKVKAALQGSPDIYQYFTLEVLPANPKHLSVYGPDHLIVTRAQLSAPPMQAIFMDQYNNPVPDVPVTFIISSGEGEIFGSNPKYSDADGIVRCHITPAEYADQIEVLATSPNDPGKLLTYHLTAVNNTVPNMLDIADLSVNEGELIEFQVSATDADGDSLSLGIENLPDGAGETLFQPGVWNFFWTPAFNQSGNYQLIFYAYDGYGGADWDTVSIDVANVNRKPVVSYFSPAKDTSITPGSRVSFEVNAFDPDGDPVSIFWYKNDSLVSKYRTYDYRADQAFTGSETVSVSVSDGHDTVTVSWVISVKTAVEMAELTARVNDRKDGIDIHWRTNKEINNLGFEIWRSTRRDGFYEMITPGLIDPKETGDYFFADDSVAAGVTYYYKVVDKNLTGAKMDHGPVMAQIPLPASYQLEQSYPNPFALNLRHSSAVIKFQIPARALVKIKIYNVLGKQVWELEEKQFPAGYHQIQWNGRDRAGKVVSSGIYYYVFRAGPFKAVKRLVLIR